MPSGSKKGEHRGGRKKGTPNKSNADIKAAIDSVCDFSELIKVLYGLAKKGDVPAIKMLFEYRYGKPSQTVVNLDGGIDEKSFDQMCDMFPAAVRQKR